MVLAMSSAPDRESLETWAKALADEIAVLGENVRRAESELEAAEERLQLVERLIEVESPAGLVDTEPILVTSGKDTPPRAKVEDAAAGNALTLEDAVAAILAEAREPLHISTIRESLVERDVPIPGQGTDANVIVKIRQQPRFSRTARGTYALAEWGLPSLDSRKKSKKRVAK